MASMRSTGGNLGFEVFSGDAGESRVGGKNRGVWARAVVIRNKSNLLLRHVST